MPLRFRRLLPGQENRQSKCKPDIRHGIELSANHQEFLRREAEEKSRVELNAEREVRTGYGDLCAS